MKAFYKPFTDVNNPLVVSENLPDFDLFIVKSVSVGNADFSSEYFIVACRPVKTPSDTFRQL